jgi:hypothetical protein
VPGFSCSVCAYMGSMGSVCVLSPLVQHVMGSVFFPKPNLLQMSVYDGLFPSPCASCWAPHQFQTRQYCCSSAVFVGLMQLLLG